MVKAVTGRVPFARLSFADGEVVVTPRDQDIFLISAEKATEACRGAVQRDQRIERFVSEILMPLHNWCAGHEASVRACWIPVPRGHIQVFIVTNGTQFDFELAIELAELERNLACGGWRIGVLQLPYSDEETLATFINPEGALEVYAQRGSASEESGG